MPQVDIETRVKAVLETHGLLDHVSEEEFGVFVAMLSLARANRRRGK